MAKLERKPRTRVKTVLGKTKNVPRVPGVYFLKNARGKILYVGKARNLRNRVRSYFQPHSVSSGTRTNLVDEIAGIDWQETDSEIEALLLESRLIKKIRPRYNVLMRDDKQYFFVGFTREELPRIFITHQPSKSKRQPSSPEPLFESNPRSRGQVEGKTKGKKFGTADFIGPFTDGSAIKKTLRILRKTFPYYTRRHPKIKCIYCHLDLCPGPNPDKKEYRKNIKNIKKVLRGKRTTLIKKLEKEMREAAKKENFEKAAKIRDKISALENVFRHTNVLSLDVHFRTYENERGRASIMKKLLKDYLGINLQFKKRIRIEGYDVSNIQGKYATGSMVVFVLGESDHLKGSDSHVFAPDKNECRKFRIKTVKSANDVAMLKEVLRRRFRHTEWPMPDLILIDGGKAQQNAALEAIKLYGSKAIKMKVVALAKKHEEIYIPGKLKPIKLSKNSPLLLLLMHIRDEAHRFAIGYYRGLHRKSYQ